MNPSGAQTPPPSFEDARNRRQRVRATGLDPNHWYVAAEVSGFAPGTVREVVFWKRSIALYRGEDGEFHALENRCAHRQLKLSHGVVDGCRLVCQYHGWAHGGDGRVEQISHERFGHDRLRLGVPAVPLKVRYGLVWLFPGDPERADTVPMPEIPELEPGSGWTRSVFEFKWTAHHSMVLENVSDYTHEYLHRRTKPFSNARQVSCEVDGDSVRTVYQAKIGAGGLPNLLIDRSSTSSGLMGIDYDYPYSRSNTDDYVKHFISMMPVDESHTHFFFIFAFRRFKVPFTSLKFPLPLNRTLVRLGRPLIGKVMEEDRAALEWEMEAYERHWDAPAIELNPQVVACQDITIRRWQEYLASQAEKPRAAAEREVQASTAAGTGGASAAGR